MQRLLFIILMLYATAVQAQQIGTKWMTAPTPTDSACQWFRHTFIADKSPRRASVCIASYSRFVLYVNGRNVSTALYMPNRKANENQPIAITFDVTRFLRPDSNTVSVLACPAISHNCSTTKRKTNNNTNAFISPAIAVNFFGTTIDNHLFSYLSPEGWLCHSASTYITQDGELMDGRANAQLLAYGDIMLAQWQPARTLEGDFFTVNSLTNNYKNNAIIDFNLSYESLFGYHTHSYSTLKDNTVRAYKILRPRYFDLNGRTVTYDFSPGFFGFVRVTLRGCKRGEHIRIGNLEYVCSGEMDEQAFCRFTHQYARQIILSGDRWFKPEQIQEVEAICL